MDDSQEQQQILAYELEALGRLLRQRLKHKSDASDADERPMQPMAIAKLCRGLTASDWEDIVAELNLHHWIALPLDSGAMPLVGRLQEQLEELAVQAEQDPLTGLLNRRAFDRVLQLELERIQRAGGYLSLAILDLDNFKSVNDTYGHPTGDEVLRALADDMRRTKRAYDINARVGGEEFALILPGTGGHKGKAMLERLLETFTQRVFTTPGGKEFRCSFSAGVASLRGRAKTDAAGLFELADQALYEAKKVKNLIVVKRIVEEPVFPKTTMVHSNEKQFLFSR